MKNALEQLQTALNGVSVSAEELQKLSESSSAIKTGIDTLAAGTANLQTQLNFEAYKAVMAQNGVDIDALQSGNAQAIDSLNSLLGQVATYEKILNDLGIPTDAIAPIEGQCVDLANQLITLLNGNNAAIGGMSAYLNEVQQGAAGLTAGAEELKANYSNFDASIHTLVNTLTDLVYQMTELKDAVNALVEEYEKLDTGLEFLYRWGGTGSCGIRTAFRGSRKSGRRKQDVKKWKYFSVWRNERVTEWNCGII